MPALFNKPQANCVRDMDDSHFRRLLEVMPAAAYTCDTEGLITSFNQRAVEVWGREPVDPAALAKLLAGLLLTPT
jgi:PAS domain-containing protein